MQKELQGAAGGGQRGGMMGMGGGIRWAEDGKSFTFPKDGKTWTLRPGHQEDDRGPGDGRPAPAQGMMGRAAADPSAAGSSPRPSRPTRSWKALYRDRNLWLSDADGKNAVAADHRRQREGPHQVRHGQLGLRRGARTRPRPCGGRPTPARSPSTASTRARSPITSSRWTRPSSTPRPTSKPTPRPGSPIPWPRLFVYDVDAKTTIKVDVRDGKPFEDAVVGHYVYRVAWSPDGGSFSSTGRTAARTSSSSCAADPATGKVRVILREEWPTGWVENSPVDDLAQGQQALPVGLRAHAASATSTSTTSAASCWRR